MGKISEFTKKELFDYMTATGEINRYDYKAASWKRAFQLCKDDGNPNLEMNCSSCVNKVSEWLKRP